MADNFVLPIASCEVQEPLQGDKRCHKNWEKARPPQWERNAIKLLMDLMKQDKTPEHPGFNVHIAHMSDTGSLAKIAEAKKAGEPVPPFLRL